MLEFSPDPANQTFIRLYSDDVLVGIAYKYTKNLYKYELVHPLIGHGSAPKMKAAKEGLQKMYSTIGKE